MKPHNNRLTILTHTALYAAITLAVGITACTTATTEQQHEPVHNTQAIVTPGPKLDNSSTTKTQAGKPSVTRDEKESQSKNKPNEMARLNPYPVDKVEETVMSSETDKRRLKDSDQSLVASSPVSPQPSVSAVLQKSEPFVEGKIAELSVGQGMIARQDAAKRLALPAGIPDQWRIASEPLDRENYDHYKTNPVKLVMEEPVSTFSIDVDTGSYTNVRRILKSGRLPQRDAVRVEEFINYFNYEYPAPKTMNVPFNVITEVGPNPWSQHSKLLHIGIKGYEVSTEQLPPANLVFLIDVSGSMQDANKLELLKNSLKMLTQKLRPQDKISIVVYAGASGVILEPTPGTEKYRILSALESLTAGGSTNGAAGIKAAYTMAEAAFIPGGINRVLLATDGDFNVGTVNFDALKNLVEEKRKSGVSLTTLGFGAGNYNDKLMEQLADVGNGNYAYIDTLNEAQKVLVDQMGSTLKTIAKDVKIQIEFNPAVVSEYRLIGYENRALRREDFNNDKIDAGEIGAGHTVTALYEIVLTDSKTKHIDPLRYQSTDSPHTNVSKHDSNILSESANREIAYLRLRYKQPDSDTSQLIETPIQRSQILASLESTSPQYQFAASVAAFGQLLRGGEYTESYTLNDVLKLARQSKGQDPYGYRSEFIQLVNLATSLTPIGAPALSQSMLE